ncbi:hypothetical protein PROFUN_05131 [Planoprotostelium fungivorum]|uniref:Uncharacterized protein n=1 Tax=Planoprotostelium fungivorum TaxID=1890364 RepID=A0A2P6NRP4_9EUKA|nr:hypothetical protein PROFUN_05131 [Planoprotostelium fungivorum]
MEEQTHMDRQQVALELFMATDKASVLIVCEPEIKIVMLNERAKNGLAAVLSSSAKSEANETLWRWIKTVASEGKPMKQKYQVGQLKLTIKYVGCVRSDANRLHELADTHRLKRVVLGELFYVTLTARDDIQPDGSLIAENINPEPLDQISLLVKAIEGDVINRLLGFDFYITLVSQVILKGVSVDHTLMLSKQLVDGTFTIYAANPMTVTQLGFNHPNALGIPKELIAEGEKNYRESFNVHTSRSIFNTQTTILNEIMPGILLGLSFKKQTPSVTSGPSPPAITPACPMKWPKNKWDGFIEECLLYISDHPQHSSPSRQKLPAEFLEDGQRVYGYVYGGAEDFLPSGNADGYIWKSSRVTYHPGKLKRRYFYTQTPAGQKLRRRIMWLEGNDNLCMVEYGHLSHSGDVEAEKLMGPDSMDWTNLISRVSAQDTHAFLSSTEELHDWIDVAGRTHKDELSTDSVVSYVSGILHNWASQQHLS